MTTKPDDVTDAVWAAATGLANELMLGSDMAFQPENGTDMIARAIMSAEKRGEEREREACAVIAETMKDSPVYYVDGRPNAQPIIGGKHIAEAIRSRK